MAGKIKNEDILKQYIPLKRYTNDLPYDLGYIIENRFERFKPYLDDFSFEQMRVVIKDFKSMASEALPQSDLIRIYIFYDIKTALFVSLDFPKSELENFNETLYNQLAASPKKFRTKPEHISTIYIFQGDKLTYSGDLYPREVAEIVSYYHSNDFLVHKLFA